MSRDRTRAAISREPLDLGIQKRAGFHRGTRILSYLQTCPCQFRIGLASLSNPHSILSSETWRDVAVPTVLRRNGPSGRAVLTKNLIFRRKVRGYNDPKWRYEERGRRAPWRRRVDRDCRGKTRTLGYVRVYAYSADMNGGQEPRGERTYLWIRS